MNLCQYIFTSMLKKCITDNCFKNTFTCLMVFWSIISFGLAIYGALQLDAFSKHKYHEGGVWNFCIGACVVDFLLPIACMVSLRSFVNDQGSNQLLTQIFVFEFVITIWAIVIYHYNCNHNYIDFWIKNATGLMVAVYAHYAYVCIHLFLVIFVFVAMCNDCNVHKMRTTKI